MALIRLALARLAPASSTELKFAALRSQLSHSFVVLSLSKWTGSNADAVVPDGIGATAIVVINLFILNSVTFVIINTSIVWYEIKGEPLPESMQKR